MLISGRYGFIFAAASKNASSTVEGILANNADVMITISKYGQHSPVAQIKQKFSQFFNEFAPYEQFYSFGIVREPINRIISKFNFRSQFGEDHKKFCGAMTFEEFAEELCSKKPDQTVRVNPQAKFFEFTGDGIGVDCLVRLEKFAADSGALGTRLGLDFQGEVKKGVQRNKTDVVRVRRGDIPEDIIKNLEKKFEKDVELYRWVSDQHARGWSLGNDKPVLKLDGEKISDFFREHYPDLHAASLRTQLRLRTDLPRAQREVMYDELLKLAPDLAPVKGVAMGGGRQKRMEQAVGNTPEPDA